MATHRTALLTAAGVALAVGLTAAPAIGLAGTRPELPGDRATGCTGSGAYRGGDGDDATGRRGGGRGWSGMGMGMGMGMLSRYASGELTAEQRATLAATAEEEKLALDLYTAFADRYDDAAFAHVAAAESRHLTAVRTLLSRYDVADPTDGLAAGEFADDAVAGRYGELLAQGESSLDDAYAAARAVEQDDLTALEAAASGVTAEDVAHLYAQLARAGERHLAVFGG